MTAHHNLTPTPPPSQSPPAPAPVTFTSGCIRVQITTPVGELAKFCANHQRGNISFSVTDFTGDIHFTVSSACHSLSPSDAPPPENAYTPSPVAAPSVGNLDDDDQADQGDDDDERVDDFATSPLQTQTLDFTQKQSTQSPLATQAPDILPSQSTFHPIPVRELRREHVPKLSPPPLPFHTTPITAPPPPRSTKPFHSTSIAAPTPTSHALPFHDADDMATWQGQQAPDEQTLAYVDNDPTQAPPPAPIPHGAALHMRRLVPSQICPTSQDSRPDDIITSDEDDAGEGEGVWHADGLPAHKRPLVESDGEDGNKVSAGDGNLFLNKRVRFSSGREAAAERADDVNAPWAAVAVVNADVLTPRWGASLVRIDASSALLLGGESEGEGVLDQALTFLTEDREWCVGIPNAPVGNPMVLPTPRTWHSATKIGENVYIYGGEVEESDGERTPLSDFTCLDLNMGCYVPLQTTGPQPGARSGHAACKFEDKLVIWGGVRGTKWLSDMYMFDTHTLAWKKCKVKTGSTSRPSARSYATLTVVEGKLILYAGNDKNRSMSDIHIGTLDRKNGEVTGGITWREPMLIGQSKPIARTGHFSVASAKGELVVGCGWDDLGIARRFYSDVWKLIIMSDSEYRWKLIHKGVQNNAPSSQPGARAGAAVCESSGCASNALLVGGLAQNGEVAGVFEILTDKAAVGSQHQSELRTH